MLRKLLIITLILATIAVVAGWQETPTCTNPITVMPCRPKAGGYGIDKLTPAEQKQAGGWKRKGE